MGRERFGLSGAHEKEGYLVLNDKATRREYLIVLDSVEWQIEAILTGKPGYVKVEKKPKQDVLTYFGKIGLDGDQLEYLDISIKSISTAAQWVIFSVDT